MMEDLKRIAMRIAEPVRGGPAALAPTMAPTPGMTPGRWYFVLRFKRVA